MGDELGRIFRPPEPVRKTCAAALKAMAAHNRKGVEWSAALAKHLEAGGGLTVATLRRLHGVLGDGVASPGIHKLADDGGPSTDGLIFSLLGGADGYAWADDVLKGEGLLDNGNGVERVERTGQIIKVDDALGVVFGWAIVSKENGVPYFDTQGDHIPEESMLNAAVDFMANSRALGDMHAADEGGTVLFAFPMTAEIAKAFGLETQTTGLMIGVKPLRKATLAKFKSGEYSGFSIGGRRKVDEEVAA